MATRTRRKQWMYVGVAGLVIGAVLLGIATRSESDASLEYSARSVDTIDSDYIHESSNEFESFDAAETFISTDKTTWTTSKGQTKKYPSSPSVDHAHPVPESSKSKYPDWWLRSWPRSAVTSLKDNFVGDEPLFPPCTESYTGKKGYSFVEPRDFLPRSKNPCWFEGNNEKGFRCAPYFYLAGVAKGGTTDLYRRIRVHPDVMFGTEKEYHWWDRDRYKASSRDSEGVIKIRGGTPFRDYLSKITGNDLQEVAADLHDTGSSVKIFGDGSPSYMWDSFNWVVLEGNQGCMEPRVITGHHIRHFYPQAKIILTFRHPTSRLYSRFLSRIPRTPALKQATAQDFHKYVARGVKMYRECFERWSVRHCAYNSTIYKDAVVRLVEGMYPVFMADWLRIWPKEQMLILRYEDYSTDMPDVLKKTFDFLELAPLTKSQWKVVLAGQTSNSGTMYDKIGKMMTSTRMILDEFYQPFIDQFAEILGDDRFLWKDVSH